jgi:hypothetical protein
MNNTFLVDSNYMIESPNLSDCEIRTIEFQHPNLSLSLMDVVKEKIVTLKAEDVTFVSISSDHMQNVIGSLYIIDFRKSPEAVPSVVYEIMGKHGLFEDVGSAHRRGLTMLVIEPVAGAAVICAAKAFHIS